MAEAKFLPECWYAYSVREGACEDSPGIYEWRIIGYGSYIGKFKRISRPTRHYARNVTNLLNKRPYRLSKPEGFRPIHRTLNEAVAKRRFIELIILENPPLDQINQREQELIKERGRLNVPPYGGRGVGGNVVFECGDENDLPPDYVDGANDLLAEEDRLSEAHLVAMREARFDRLSAEAWKTHRG